MVMLTIFQSSISRRAAPGQAEAPDEKGGLRTSELLSSGRLARLVVAGCLFALVLVQPGTASPSSAARAAGRRPLVRQEPVPPHQAPQAHRRLVREAPMPATVAPAQR